MFTGNPYAAGGITLHDISRIAIIETEYGIVINGTVSGDLRSE